MPNTQKVKVPFLRM